MSLASLFKEVISLSLMGSVLALVIIVFKVIFKERINAKWHYYIWILLIIRLIVPYALDSPISIFNMAFPVMQNVESFEYKDANFDSDTLDSINEENKETELKVNENITINNISQNSSINTELNQIRESGKVINYELLSKIWLFGVVAILFYFLLLHLKLYFEISKETLCKDEEILENLNQCKLEMNIQGNIEILHYEKISSPCVFGLIKPKLLLPYDITSVLSYEEMRYVLLHELSHIKKKDILINYIVMFARALHWFNLFIWFSFHKMQQDCEIACDAYVLSHIESVEHKKYGETIINLIGRISQRSWNPVITPMANNKSDTKRRIERIANFNKKSLKWSLVAFVILIGIILTIMTNGSYGIFKNDTSPKVNIVVEARELTKEEFDRVGTEGLVNPTIDDFRILYVDVQILNSKKVKNKILEVPEYGDYHSVLDGEQNRVWSGSSFYQNNDGEDFSQATREIVVYYKGLDDSKLSEMLQPLKVKVGWQTRNGESTEKEYSVGEQLLVEKNEISQQDIREIVYNQLTSEERDSINGTWQEALVQKVILSENMGRIEDKAYIGKEVYLIDFPTNNNFVPNNMVVYASIDDYKLVGYGYVE